MRISCCVPFCKRTRGDWKHDKLVEGSEWICQDHWPLVPKHYRRRDGKSMRRYTKKFGRTQFWEYPAGSPQRIEAVRLARLCDKSWRICKRIAIERAVGI